MGYKPRVVLPRRILVGKALTPRKPNLQTSPKVVLPGRNIIVVLSMLDGLRL